MEVWSTKKSAELYLIDSWGAGFFKINEKGNVEVSPRGTSGAATAQATSNGNGTVVNINGATYDGGIDLKELVSDLEERGLRPPLLIRFPDIVHSRVKLISNAFQTAIDTYNYKGKFRGVFPIKVNQQRYLVEDMMRFGRETCLGLEAGSKPELLVALALMDNPDALLICNGFKDAEYIETALLSQKLGRNTIVVLDRFSELETIINSAKTLGIRPRIGFRAKLEAKGAGKWVESSGAKSKFGLTASEMVKGIEILEREGLLSSLELLHFHIGSQITALRAIKDSLIEASRVYVELASMGAGLKYLDVGGGLGIDYDGSQTNSENSMNYTVQEYANDVVAQIAAACDSRGLPHPHIVTEAGRALIAHHSVLVFDIVGAHTIRSAELPEGIESEKQESIKDLLELYKSLSPKNLNEHIQDAFRLRDDAMSLFNLGYLTLKQKALVERLFWCFCTRALEVSETMGRKPEEIVTLKRYLSDSYYSNFSVFQSAPDTWAVKQLFPVMPIHRLKEEPTRRGILLDLTCDSDGKIDHFIDIKDEKETLELHPLRDGEDYYVGMFLIGAYQEILGDFHNLFGDTDAVHVSLTASGYAIEHVIEGDTVNEVLSYVQYDRASLIRQIRTAIEAALSKKTISLEESRMLMRYYEDGLNSYTYLDHDAKDRGVDPVHALRQIGQKQADQRQAEVANAGASNSGTATST
ncbi:MAG: biosynthetic arginine decarboxylase [Bdellovibrionales bacterium]|nr:biosynthetic arginine decarboxylase [Bdellovibrionales bacterium]